MRSWSALIFCGCLTATLVGCPDNTGGESPTPGLGITPTSAPETQTPETPTPATPSATTATPSATPATPSATPATSTPNTPTATPTPATPTASPATPTPNTPTAATPTPATPTPTPPTPATPTPATPTAAPTPTPTPTPTADPATLDLDADGYAPVDGDCDDADPAIFPGATEICDGVDNSCDGTVDEGVLSTFYADADSDGFGDPAVALQACTLPEGAAATALDCDDGDPAVSPDAAEICDEVDNNCDGQTDEGVLSTFYVDSDVDGYGDEPVLACEAPEGAAAEGGDCDDSAAQTFPGADELCDEADNDCDEAVDEGVLSTFYADADSDSYGDAESTLEACLKPLGYVAIMGDCDDADAAVNEGAVEVCDGIDNDCVAGVDDPGAADATLWYPDDDGDGYGQDSDATVACMSPEGTSPDAGDCDDANAGINPDAEEICDGLDNDCDGVFDLLPGEDFSCLRIYHFQAAGTNTSLAYTGGYGYSNLGAMLTAGGATWQEGTAALTDTLLADFDILMVGNVSHTLTAEELAAVDTFVSGGGGLFVQDGFSGSSSEADWHNAFTSPYDLTYGGGLVSGACTVISSHPLTDGVTQLTGQGGKAITVGGTGQALCSTTGGLTYMASNEVGEGRVVAFYDEWIWFNSGGSYGWDVTDHQVFARNLFRWLGGLD